MSLLLQAARSWVDISKSYYIIIYGLRKTLYSVKIMFDNCDFYHLAGFQYLKDLQLPAVSQSKIIENILDGEIDGEYIKSGAKYSTQVESRLIALSCLEYSLDSNFNLYSYTPRNYPFYTKIEAEYLIEGYTEDNSLFFFTVKTDGHYNGASIFMKGDRDFSINQKMLSLLKIEKVNIETGRSIVLMDKLSSQKPLSG